MRTMSCRKRQESWRRHGHAPPPDALVFATIRRRAIDLARREQRRE
jgi:RNA polymerase sigma-70 factor (ECF subfamily)